MILDPIQEDREMCEVPGCDRRGTDWDHCIFTKNKRFKKYVDNPLNMLRACAICNRITKKTDRWETKKWLIDYHLKYNREALAEWINEWPIKFKPNHGYKIRTYIQTNLERIIE